MILRSVRLEGLGCFADTFTAGPFAPGLNVVYAPNGTGKTTLVRGISFGFLESHRTRAAELQALRPWGRRLAPQVSIEFEHSGRIYRSRKQFLDGASSNLETREGDTWTSFARGDEADAFLREVLKTDADRPRAVKRESWGLAQVLWTTQGDLSLPSFSPNVIESIRGSIGAHLSANDSAIQGAIDEEFRRFFTPGCARLKSGRNGAPQMQMEAERVRLSGELQTAEELWKQFEVESARIEELRSRSEAARVQRQALQQELEHVRSSVKAYEDLLTEQKIRSARRDAASATQKQFRDRIEQIFSLRNRIEASEKSLAKVAAQIPDFASKSDELRKAAERADQMLESAARNEQQAREAVATAQLAQEYAGARDQHQHIAQRLADIETAHAEIRKATERLAAITAPSDAQIRELRSVIGRESDAVRRLEMARITVGFTPEKPVEIEVLAGEQPGKIACAPKTTVRLAGAPSLTFAIGGIGRFEASGPVSDYETIRKALDHDRAWLVTFARQFGSSDPEVLQARRQEITTLESSIREMKRALAKVLGSDTEAGLLEATARLTARTQEIEAAHPHWTAASPEPVALYTSAIAGLDRAMAERKSAAASAASVRNRAIAAGAAIEQANSQRDTLLAGISSDRSLLSAGLSDGLTDEQRHERLDNAVLDFDACRLALAGVETKLAEFAADPRRNAERLSADLARLERDAAQSQNDLVRAETRIQGLVDRRPYAAYAELSERLAALDEQLGRERLRMNALAMLHKVIDEANAEAMTTIASPIERIASDYLEEICGHPIGEICLTQELAAEQVTPTALAGGADDRVALDRLSGGEQEQIFLCTRLAIGSHLAGQERQMLVLDDVLTFTDDDRLARVCELLARLSDRLQVVLLTCHPERFAALPGAKRIDLTQSAARFSIAGRG